MSQLNLSVVIPTFNEQNRLAKTLDTIRKFLDGANRSYEVIVADDGSRDNTIELATNTATSWPQLRVLPSSRGNVGKGDAVTRGMLASTGRLVLFTDADNAVPITELPKLEAWITDYDMVVGSKHAPESVNIGNNSTRRLLSYLAHLAISWLAVPDVHDTQCGFKLFRQEAAQAIFKRVTVERFGFDIELFVIARSLGLPYKEVGVSWSADEDSRVRPLRDALNTLTELFRIVRNRTAGLYK